MVDTYADPYTVFIEPQPRQREKEDLSGEFGGIGAWVSQDEDGTIRLKPMVDRAAEKAGLVDRDILKAVDDVQITPEMTTDDVVSLIRGPIGEPVTVTIYRESNSATLAIEVIRERIETPSVEWRILEENTQVGYLAINLFSERTAKELDRALDDLREQGATQLILDLRHNPGGLLQGAVDVASRFLSNGVVLFERKSDGSETTYRVVNAQRVADWPMAILVDGATASASEIVAGALQDRGRAKLVGEKTFGKGSVQFVHDLSDGSSIHVTVAHWLTPNGHEINGIGLTPDVEAPQVEDGDAPLDAALRLLNP
jgi:carboxyl-terminal processing protease